MQNHPKFWLSSSVSFKIFVFDEPQFRQYLQLALINGVPMFGFGFVDNVGLLMIGDVLDSTICMRLGLSTFFAAACANTVTLIIIVNHNCSQVMKTPPL